MAEPTERKQQESPFPIRLGAMKAELEAEAEKQSLSLTEYIKGILRTRHILKEGPDPEKEILLQTIQEQKELIDKTAQKLKDWGIN